MTIDAADRQTLLSLARRSIELGSRGDRGMDAPSVDSPALQLQRASFVTLLEHGNLRGCCGSIEAHAPLADDVWRNARASAFGDPRFAPLASYEIDAIDVHISVLSPLTSVPVTTERELLAVLRPQRDGLLLKLGAARATFLPSVWESVETPHQFVRQLKLKAGWSADFWSPQIEVWRYETESFGEREH